MSIYRTAQASSASERDKAAHRPRAFGRFAQSPPYIANIDL
jgi:hypothetical protein